MFQTGLVPSGVLMNKHQMIKFVIMKAILDNKKNKYFKSNNIRQFIFKLNTIET